MNEKTKLISLAKVKRAMNKLKQVLTKKMVHCVDTRDDCLLRTSGGAIFTIDRAKL